MNNKLSLVFSKIKENNFYRNISILTSGTILAQIISIVTLPLLSRIYTEKAFGEFSLISSVAAIVLGLITLGLSSAIMVPEDDQSSNQIFGTVLITQFILATVFIAICLLISPWYQLFSTSISYVFACFLMYLYILATNVMSLMTVSLNRKMMYKVLFRNSLINAFATLFVTVPIGFLNGNAAGYLIGSIIGSVIAILQMMHNYNPLNTRINIKTMCLVFCEYKDYIIFQCPANFVGNLAIQLPTQFLGNFYGNEALGGYGMCQKLLAIPSRIIGSPISTVYFSTVSEYHREGKKVGKFTFSLISKILLASFFPAIIIMLFGKEIFIFILGDNWGGAGVIASILVIKFILSFCNQCTSYLRVALGLQRVNLYMTIIQIFVTIITLLIGYYLQHNIIGAVLLYAIGDTLFQMCSMIIDFIYMEENPVFYSTFVLSYVTILISVGLILNRVL